MYKWKRLSVRPQMADFGSGQGLSDFETGGARRKCPWGE